MMYSFEELDKKLNKLGFPKISPNSGFKVIRYDFKKAYDEGKIDFREDGIYLLHEGKEWRGYMYMPTYRVQKYNQFSRFHLVKCDVIQDFINGGMFNLYYKWSNDKTNDIEDRDTRQLYNSEKLQLCSKCKSLLISSSVQDTQDFHKELDKSVLEKGIKEVDIFGYTKDKKRISDKHRQSKNYTCDTCGVKCKRSIHKRWWHTHHIDGDKTNNAQGNLQCLCVKCHANIDERHQNNFSKSKWKIEIQFFEKEYHR